MSIRTARGGARKLSRRMFYLLGGLSNPDLFRRMVRGYWTYYME